MESSAGTASHEPLDGTGLNARERYCIGMITGEMAEVAYEIASGDRFGYDNPNPQDPDDSPRRNLSREAGDVEAAILFGKLHGLIDPEIAGAAREAKIKLLLSDATNRTGARLAPKVPEISTSAFFALDPLNTYRAIINLLTSPVGEQMAHDLPDQLVGRLITLCYIALGNTSVDPALAEQLMHDATAPKAASPALVSPEDVINAWEAERRRCSIRGMGQYRAIYVDGAMRMEVVDTISNRAHEKASDVVRTRCAAAVLKMLGLGPGPDATE